jgi:hypothetical protein
VTDGGAFRGRLSARSGVKMSNSESKFRLLVKATPSASNAQLSLNGSRLAFNVTPLGEKASQKRRSTEPLAVWHLVTPIPSDALVEAGRF